MECEDVIMDAVPAPAPAPAIETVLSAGATAAALTSTATVASVGAAAAAAAVGMTEAHLQAQSPVIEKVDAHLNSPSRGPQVAPAWDLHLDNPPCADPVADKMMQVARSTLLGLSSDNVRAFIDACEFISLGCFCSVSNALQLLGLKRNSYPFDWVRSSLEGVTHCLDVQFEDFLTYSTYTMTDQYAIFGGTRWGGSFWHHNLEVPVTRQDMARRVSRFYGQENIAACTPRVFVRSINSTREITAVLRFRQALKDALPEAQQVFILFIVDIQPSEGPMAIAGQDGHGLLFYGIRESETLQNMSQGAQAFRLNSETYTRAIACAIKFWAGDTVAEEVRMFSNVRELGAACVQFDGGDPGRELFTPRKFYGQHMGFASEAPKFQSLFFEDAGTDVSHSTDCTGALAISRRMLWKRHEDYVAA